MTQRKAFGELRKIAANQQAQIEQQDKDLSLRLRQLQAYEEDVRDRARQTFEAMFKTQYDRAQQAYDFAIRLKPWWAGRAWVEKNVGSISEFLWKMTKENNTRDDDDSTKEATTAE